MADKPRTASARSDGDKPGDKPAKKRRLRQLRDTYRMAKKSDPRIGLYSIGAGVVTVLAFVGIGFLILDPIITGFLGLATGLLVATFIFGRRAERAAYAQVEGQPGAAAAVLNSLRRGWVVTPAIAVTRNQDVVHRAVGRCGIVLVGEGAPTRVAQLLASEKKRHHRVAPDAPLYDIIVGDAPGQIALRALNRHLIKLPRSLRPAEITDIMFRLKAMQTSPVPIPKGPIPQTTKIPRSAKMR